MPIRDSLAVFVWGIGRGFAGTEYRITVLLPVPCTGATYEQRRSHFTHTLERFAVKSVKQVFIFTLVPHTRRRYYYGHKPYTHIPVALGVRRSTGPHAVYLSVEYPPPPPKALTGSKLLRGRTETHQSLLSHDTSRQPQQKPSIGVQQEGLA